MNPRNTNPTITESLAGFIERVTFHNEDTGFGVFKVKAKGHRDLVTVVGTLASVSPGEWINAEGQLVQDREFGQQFRAEILTSSAPTTKEGIERFLGSGMWRRHHEGGTARLLRGRIRPRLRVGEVMACPQLRTSP